MPFVCCFVVLQSFYLSLRASSCGGVSGGLPITARQLESLVRLAEARARAELREVVTAEDALVRCSWRWPS
jgi:DNA helicase MCM8